jgi:hypothetical protein
MNYSNLTADLERMIDAAGLSDVLYALAEVCGEKSVHLAENWQDVTSAKAWDKHASAIETLASRLRRAGE